MMERKQDLMGISSISYLLFKLIIYNEDSSSFGCYFDLNI